VGKVRALTRKYLLDKKATGRAGSVKRACSPKACRPIAAKPKRSLALIAAIQKHPGKPLIFKQISLWLHPQSGLYELCGCTQCLHKSLRAAGLQKLWLSPIASEYAAGRSIIFDMQPATPAATGMLRSGKKKADRLKQPSFLFSTNRDNRIGTQCTGCSQSFASAPWL
jgi:hypothetical protein